MSITEEILSICLSVLIGCHLNYSEDAIFGAGLLTIFLFTVAPYVMGLFKDRY